MLSYIKVVLFWYVLVSIIGVIIVGYFFISAYHKLKHPFWYSQPVQYKTVLRPNITLFGNNPRVIQTYIPPIDKWTNHHNIKFVDDYHEISKFISDNYADNNNSCDFTYNLSLDTFNAIMDGHNYPIYAAIYSIMNTDEHLGAITAQPLNIELYNKGRYPRLIHDDPTYENIVYYVDNLCVKLEHRGEKIAPQLIQTLNNFYRTNNTVSMISLFKRETQLPDYIIPLTTYFTYQFNIATWFNKPFELHPSVKLLEITQQNIQLLYAFLFKYKSHYFKCFIYPELTNICSQMKVGNIFIMAIMSGDNICSVYFYRNANVEYKGDKTIECIGSINCNQTLSFFITGFYYSLQGLTEKHEFKYLHYENISHNTLMCKSILKHNSPVNYSNTGWYLYNYIHPTLDSKIMFILN